MSHGDSFDTFSGPAVTWGDGSLPYRALRIARDELTSVHPAAIGEVLAGAPNALQAAEPVRLAEVLSRPESVDLQVFVVQIEGEGEYLALADRAAIVNYPVEHIVIRITEWGAAHARDVLSRIAEIPGADDAGGHVGEHEDRLRATSADRDQAGRHAHHPARRQRTGPRGNWVG